MILKNMNVRQWNFGRLQTFKLGYALYCGINIHMRYWGGSIKKMS